MDAKRIRFQDLMNANLVLKSEILCKKMEAWAPVGGNTHTVALDLCQTNFLPFGAHYFAWVAFDLVQASVHVLRCSQCCHSCSTMYSVVEIFFIDHFSPFLYLQWLVVLM